jgi:mRNA-degrading endonuclease RelE of RelBE toxin-antitoxin system
VAFEVHLTGNAIRSLEKLRAFDRAAILDCIERVLRQHPEQEGHSRVKRLRQPAPAAFRLRVGEFRVFYDVAGATVMVVKVLHKRETGPYMENCE